jgi:hypothetical protein
MGNFALKDMQVKRMKNGELLLLFYLQDESTGKTVNWAADWDEFARIFEASFLVERANLIERLKRLINKVVSTDTVPLTKSLKRVLQTSKETERKFEELKGALSPLGEEATAELVKIGVKFPESEKEIDLKTIRNNWKQFANSLAGEGPSGNLDAFIRTACEPVAIEDGVLVLGFYYMFHKEKVENPQYAQVVERKLKEFFGKPYKIRCILIDRATM